MKKIFILSLMFVFAVQMYAQEDMAPEAESREPEILILMKTTKGDIKIKLYEKTPLHTDNFMKLVEEKFYDNLLFHRVIKGFMIQGGDPNSRNAKPNKHLGEGGPGYTIPAEIKPQFIHKRGALAAARLGDADNPKRASSGSQFYIVQGKIYTDKELDDLEAQMKVKFTDEQRMVYTTLGGVPQLDGSYTVYGEVLEGMEVIDAIAKVQTGKSDRPIIDVKILSIEVIEN